MQVINERFRYSVIFFKYNHICSVTQLICPSGVMVFISCSFFFYDVNTSSYETLTIWTLTTIKLNLGVFNLIRRNKKFHYVSCWRYLDYFRLMSCSPSGLFEASGLPSNKKNKKNTATLVSRRELGGINRISGCVPRAETQ